MRAFFAYAMLVLGVPVYVGAATGFVMAPLAWPFPDSKKRAVLDVLKVAQGIFSIGAALLIFRFLSVPAGISVLLIPLTWISVYYYSFHQPLVPWVMHVTGILVGWFFCFV